MEEGRMARHKLELLEDGNPEYYSLMNESNEITAVQNN
jgi:hypothetical protein